MGKRTEELKDIIEAAEFQIDKAKTVLDAASYAVDPEDKNMVNLIGVVHDLLLDAHDGLVAATNILYKKEDAKNV